jgi:hypothetical protein
MKALFCTAAALVGLVGCAKIDGKARDWLASTAPSYAVVDGRLYEGTATLFNDRSGTLQLVAKQAPDKQCFGTLRYTATRSGTLLLQCSGGVETTLAFTALGASSAYATGGTASLTWGLPIDSANAYLRLPEGQAPLENPPPKPWYRMLF